MKSKNKLQTVVLAGGFGTRLCPLTDTKPKPLVRILDTTVLENILEKLREASAYPVTVSTHYKPQMIREACEKFHDIVTCKEEKIPLGTAGGTKFCYDKESENVLVVSGDAVFDFDIGKLLGFHYENKNDVTIAVCRKCDPTEYGVVRCWDDGNVLGFCEKPSWKKVKSDLVNTGIYVLSKRVMDEIPDNINCDFSKNLFPRLLSLGAKMMVFEIDGFWCDIGSFDELYECNRLASGGKIKLSQNPSCDNENVRKNGIHAHDGVYISKDAVIGKNVSITDESVVCRGCEISDNCDINGCILGEKTLVGRGTSISKSIVGEGVKIGENCIIPEGCVIGDKAEIGEGTVLSKNMRVSAGEKIFTEDVMGVFGKFKNVFVEDGTAYFPFKDCAKSLMQFAFALNCALGKSEKNGITAGVMSSEAAKNFCSMFVLGLVGVNASVYDMGNGCFSQCMYGATCLPCDVFVYLDADQNGVIVKLVGDDARMVDDDTERKILKVLGQISEEWSADFSGTFNEVQKIPVVQMYKSYLVKLCRKMLSGRDFSGKTVFVPKSSMKGAAKCFAEVFISFGGKVENSCTDEAMSLSFSVDGTCLDIRQGGVQLDMNHICALLVKNYDVILSDGIYVDEKLPETVKKLVPKTEKIKHVKLSAEDNFYNDAVIGLLMLFSVMTLHGETLSELAEKIPSFEVYTDEYVVDVNRGATMERLSKLYNDTGIKEEGIHLHLAEGDVTVIPNRMSGFRIVSEAVSMEAAKELAVKIGKAIK